MRGMKLLIMTQAVDREDTNLGAFYYWFDLLARRAEGVVIIASRVGAVDFPPNVRVVSLGKEQHAGRIRRLARFTALCRRHIPESDAILFHQIPEFALAAAPFMLASRPTTALWYAHGAVTWRLRLAERIVDHVLTSSESGFRLPSKKVRHLGQAINVELFSPGAAARPPDGALRMVSVGRISPVKNYETIIAGCARLRDVKKHPWTLTVVGNPITPADFAYFEKIKALVREKSIESRITFLGARRYSEIPAILREHDMFVNASRTGSLDKAVLEAMACGLTTITSNEAYRPVLPADYVVASASADGFAERIRALRDEPRPNMALRQIVVRDHALVPVIDQIASLLAHPV